MLGERVVRMLRSWGITCVPRCYCVILAVITAKPINISENIVRPAGSRLLPSAFRMENIQVKLNEIQQQTLLQPLANSVKLSIHNGPAQTSPSQLSSAQLGAAVGPLVVVPVADFDFDMHTEAA